MPELSYPAKLESILKENRHMLYLSLPLCFCQDCDRQQQGTSATSSGENRGSTEEGMVHTHTNRRRIPATAVVPRLPGSFLFEWRRFVIRLVLSVARRRRLSRVCVNGTERPGCPSAPVPAPGSAVAVVVCWRWAAVTALSCCGTSSRAGPQLPSR